LAGRPQAAPKSPAGALRAPSKMLSRAWVHFVRSAGPSSSSATTWAQMSLLVLTLLVAQPSGHGQRAQAGTEGWSWPRSVSPSGPGTGLSGNANSALVDLYKGADGPSRPAASSSRTTASRPPCTTPHAPPPTHGQLREAFVVAVEPVGPDSAEGLVANEASHAPGNAAHAMAWRIRELAICGRQLAIGRN
jgi:hypothetical protein